MAFDPTKAQLSETQLAGASHVDTIIETMGPALEDGFGIGDLLAHPELLAPLLGFVRLLGAEHVAKGIPGVVTFLNGTQCGLLNDNADSWLGVAPESE